MQSLIINNFILNEMTAKILTSNQPVFKKMVITFLLIIALLFYGLESIVAIFFKK